MVAERAIRSIEDQIIQKVKDGAPVQEIQQLMESFFINAGDGNSRSLSVEDFQGLINENTQPDTEERKRAQQALEAAAVKVSIAQHNYTVHQEHLSAQANEWRAQSDNVEYLDFIHNGFDRTVSTEEFVNFLQKSEEALANKAVISEEEIIGTNTIVKQAVTNNGEIIKDLQEKGDQKTLDQIAEKARENRDIGEIVIDQLREGAIEAQQSGDINASEALEKKADALEECHDGFCRLIPEGKDITDLSGRDLEKASNAMEKYTNFMDKVMKDGSLNAGMKERLFAKAKEDGLIEGYDLENKSFTVSEKEQEHQGSYSKSVEYTRDSLKEFEDLGNLGNIINEAGNSRHALINAVSPELRQEILNTKGDLSTDAMKEYLGTDAFKSLAEALKRSPEEILAKFESNPSFRAATTEWLKGSVESYNEFVKDNPDAQKELPDKISYSTEQLVQIKSDLEANGLSSKFEQLYTSAAAFAMSPFNAAGVAAKNVMEVLNNRNLSTEVTNQEPPKAEPHDCGCPHEKEQPKEQPLTADVKAQADQALAKIQNGTAPAGPRDPGAVAATQEVIAQQSASLHA